MTESSKGYTCSRVRKLPSLPAAASCYMRRIRALSKEAYGSVQPVDSRVGSVCSKQW